jgi:hypothetical protein
MYRNASQPGGDGLQDKETNLRIAMGGITC